MTYKRHESLIFHSTIKHPDGDFILWRVPEDDRLVIKQQDEKGKLIGYLDVPEELMLVFIKNFTQHLITKK